MKWKDKIYLVGFMGSGKSTIGRLLAKKLKVPFIDLDKEIEIREGLTIPQIFSLKGEPYFRKLELELLKEITQTVPFFVMATGGGLGANPEAMEYMKKHGLVIWLDIDFPTFLKRTSKDSNRPLLKKSEGELRVLFDKRKNVYRKAHVSIKSSHSPEGTVQKILDYLQRIYSQK
jgi:shikimate kinase